MINNNIRVLHNSDITLAEGAITKCMEYNKYGMLQLTINMGIALAPRRLKKQINLHPLSS